MSRRPRLETGGGMWHHIGVFWKGALCPRTGSEVTKMATSSIFANIELKDSERVRAFVDALCSDKPWPHPNIKVEESQRSYEDFCKFLDDSPYATANA